ncbi:hypothetical protein AJ80_02207 [Polytolypa hystricis UAMH7299]|uniref:Uncharacterized protein n=1 Tax=Polytolypa hystricis (strain UAMH7299) TaxID=1447883 RepID=A0A2B7YT26_POLH7|nr:hypothetical protein AJ80_02207 [Polytolypa hystricis UAMH7299]
MTRVFTTDTTVFCDNCGCRPDLGCVYVCTEDSGRYQPGGGTYSMASSFYSTPTRIPATESSEGSALDLKDWMLKAIEAGHYTPEQVEILKAQRANAVKAIESPHIAQWNRSESPLLDSLKDQNARKDEQAGLIRVMRDAGLPLYRSQYGGSLIPVCHYRICQKCYPTARERSFISLREACSEHYMAGLLDAENFDRILADVNFSPALTPFLDDIHARTAIFKRALIGSRDDDDDNISTTSSSEYGASGASRENDNNHSRKVEKYAKPRLAGLRAKLGLGKKKAAGGGVDTSFVSQTKIAKHLTPKLGMTMVNSAVLDTNPRQTPLADVPDVPSRSPGRPLLSRRPKLYFQRAATVAGSHSDYDDSTATTDVKKSCSLRSGDLMLQV